MALNTVDTTIKAGGTTTVLTNEPTTKVTANTVYQITDATKRVLDPDTALVVEVDADGAGGGGYAVAAIGTYTVDYMFGIVTFAADQGANALVRVSGKYVPTLAVAEGCECEVSDSVTLLDKTVFGNTARARMVGLAEASGSFMLLALLKNDLDPGGGTTILRDAMRAGTKMLLEYRPGGGAAYWRAWVYLSQAGEKATTEGRLEGTINFSTHAPTGVGEGELAVPTWGAG